MQTHPEHKHQIMQKKKTQKPLRKIIRIALPIDNSPKKIQTTTKSTQEKRGEGKQRKSNQFITLSRNWNKPTWKNKDKNAEKVENPNLLGNTQRRSSDERVGQLEIHKWVCSKTEAREERNVHKNPRRVPKKLHEMGYCGRVSLYQSE